MNAEPWTFVQDGEAPVYSVRLLEGERAVLLDLVDDVVALLGGADEPGPATPPDAHPLDLVEMRAAPVPPPIDPAVRRLLPDASRDDPAVAAEFRRLTEADLRSAKVANLHRLRAALAGAAPDALVVAAEAPALASALTDLRLVVAERLGIETEDEAEAWARVAFGEVPVDEDDELAVAQRFLATVYHVLGALQQSLVDLMLAELPDTPATGEA